MNCRGVAPLAIFLEFEFLGLLFLVDGRSVVAPLALCAGESDYVCHVRLLPFMKCGTQSILAQPEFFTV